MNAGDELTGLFDPQKTLEAATAVECAHALIGKSNIAIVAIGRCVGDSGSLDVRYMAGGEDDRFGKMATLRLAVRFTEYLITKMRSHGMTDAEIRSVLYEGNSRTVTETTDHLKDRHKGSN